MRVFLPALCRRIVRWTSLLRRRPLFKMGKLRVTGNRSRRAVKAALENGEEQSYCGTGAIGGFDGEPILFSEGQSDSPVDITEPNMLLTVPVFECGSDFIQPFAGETGSAVVDCDDQSFRLDIGAHTDFAAAGLL